VNSLSRLRGRKRTPFLSQYQFRALPSSVSLLFQRPGPGGGRHVPDPDGAAAYGPNHAFPACQLTQLPGGPRAFPSHAGALERSPIRKPGPVNWAGPAAPAHGEGYTCRDGPPPLTDRDPSRRTRSDTRTGSRTLEGEAVSQTAVASRRLAVNGKKSPAEPAPRGTGSGGDSTERQRPGTRRGEKGRVSARQILAWLTGEFARVGRVRLPGTAGQRKPTAVTSVVGDICTVSR
jgi:hypothetical protein